MNLPRPRIDGGVGFYGAGKQIMQAWQTYNTTQDAAEYVEYECGYRCYRIECEEAGQDAGRAEGGYDQERHNAKDHLRDGRSVK